MQMETGSKKITLQGRGGDFYTSWRFDQKKKVHVMKKFISNIGVRGEHKYTKYVPALYGKCTTEKLWSLCGPENANLKIHSIHTWLTRLRKLKPKTCKHSQI